MLAEGLLELPGTPAPLPVLRMSPDGQGVRRRPPPAEPVPPTPPAGTELPRRKPGGFFRIRNGIPK